jgi:pimeloyl-ACP methyl ester carboxylesterase
MKTGRFALAALLLVVVLGAWVVHQQLPTLGAGGLLHPTRRAPTATPPATCQEADFAGAGVTLKGWKCQASAPRRGTLVYLHGIADNRTSALGVIQRFGARGFDVLAYDSRAHGESDGDACTYGFYEKEDLRRVLDRVDDGPVVLMGTSLGAAVALQSAAHPRVTAVVAAEAFADLRTVVSDRVPFFITAGAIAQAIELAEAQGHFQADQTSPVLAVAKITVPVLLIHGVLDTATPPAHSRRIFAALKEPKRLILVPHAGHNQSLRANVWNDIEAWLDVSLNSEQR